MLNSGFGELARGSIDLYPAALREEIDQLNAAIYPTLNNGCMPWFATTQVSYEEAVSDVFYARYAKAPCNAGFSLRRQLTEADIRLFVTLVRFDAAYHGVFKCNLRKLAQYPNLTAICGQCRYRHPGNGEY
jgi:putative glutathione S-transferase